MPDSDRKRVLVVDDERVIADTLSKILQQKGLDAIAVYSAEDALALMPGWIPDFAFLDVYLPGMNGIDLALRLNAHYPLCQITLISALHSALEKLDQARLQGHSLPLLEKPFHPTVMLGLVGECNPSGATVPLRVELR
jgi:CheY-like chemotaxis protein